LTAPELDDIVIIIKDLKNLKAPGGYEINPEQLKLAGKDLVTEIYFLVKDVWNNECMPKDWNLGIICLIFRKKDLFIYSPLKTGQVVHTVQRPVRTE